MQGLSVSLEGVRKSFSGKDVLREINLAVEAGEFLTLLGPSGCGKSTLLRLIAGLETPDTGQIVIGGQQAGRLPPKERQLAMVFQSYALYPHMSVLDNLATPLVMKRMSFAQRFPLLGRAVPGGRAIRDGIDQAVRRTAALLEIDHLLTRRPGALSGGQRQRVALGRALIAEPSVFLMDEPLSNLDVQLRVQMRTELADLHRRLGITFIYVTHDQSEAMAMSGRIAVIMDGSLVQVGKPRDVYHRPVDLRVARFVGQYPINLILGEVDAGGRLTGPGITPFGKFATVGPVTIGLRPEDIEVGRAGPSALAATILNAEDHGGDVLYTVGLDAAPAVRLRVRVDAKERRLNGVAAGNLSVRIPSETLHVFGADGRRVERRSSAFVPLHLAGIRV